MKRHRPHIVPTCTLAAWALACASSLAAAGKAPPAPAEPAPSAPAYQPQTAADPNVPVGELALMVKPLTVDELAAEVAPWLALVKAKVKEIADLEIAVKRGNEQIARVEQLRVAAEEASRAAEEAERAARSGGGDQEALRQARERAEQAKVAAKEAADQAKEAERRAADDWAVRKATEAAVRGAAEKSDGSAPRAGAAGAPALRPGALGSGDLDRAARAADQAAEAKAEVKSILLEDLTALRDQRAALSDRANVVLDELAAKGGEVDLERKYLTAVSGIKIEVSDTSAAWAAITGWVSSPEGGLRLARNVALCVATILGAWLLSWIAGALVRKAVGAAAGMTDLMREFLAKTVRSLILIMGVVMGLSALEINVNPLLAAIGGAALVVAFALQGTLSNFASGILILAYHPFDVGDAVEAGGVSGTVRSMNLLSTQIVTPDNRLMTVPNNQIWGSVITNSTATQTRRVDVIIEVSHGMNAVTAQQAIEEIVRKHELVLREPEPVVRLQEIGHLATKVICRPWVKSEDYWKVYWDITRAAREVLDRQRVMQANI